MTISEWESAWGAYIEALKSHDAARRETSRRSMSGYKRGYHGCRIRLRKSIERLRDLDAGFCDRIGVKGGA